MKALRRLILLFAFFLCSVSRAQTFPVQAFVQLNPPYSTYLPDYSDPLNNQLKVLLTLMDFSVPSYQVKVRFIFEGSGYSISNDNLIPFPTYTLTPGVPVEISGSDLGIYLATENLTFSGLDPLDYELRKVLPEGPMTVCVEVIDYSNPNQATLSNQSCSSVWISLFDPPLLNLPFCGTKVEVMDPQNILFSWTPLHMSSPFSIGGTEYTFELFELRPEDADPNYTVSSSLPIYMEVTTNTFVNYGIIQPQLQVGMTYVWRVRAREVSGRDVFRNKGYSAVCTFTYGSIAESLAAGVVLVLESEGTGVRQGLAWWNGSGVFESYQLEVRKTGDPSFSWFPYPTTNYILKVNDLEAETEYECRVRGISGDYEGDWSNTSTFTTLPQPVYECGSTAQPPVVSDIIPLQNALPGMTFTVGQFDMIVSSITGSSGPGRFSGFGRVMIPFMIGNLKVKFNDILVDENHFVRDGRVEALTEGIDSWIDSHFTLFEIPGVIDDFVFPGDSTVIVQFGDETVTYDFTEHGSPIHFTDETGKTYIVHSDGTVEVEGGLTLSTDHLFATSDYQVVFSADPAQEYGFDSYRYLEWQSDYEAIPLLDSGYYFTSYKSIDPGGEDVVVATVVAESGMPGLVFKTTSGRVIPHSSLGGNNYQLTLSAFTSNDFIYAYDDTLKVGKLWIQSLANKTKKVVVIPVNGASTPSESELSAQLNSVYQQANVSWSVEVVDNYSDLGWDTNLDGDLQSADATLMSKYSAEMRSLRDAYFEDHPDYDKDAYHLFVLPSFDDPAIKGYMVRGRAVGFIKSGEQAQTYAHELGHGAFDLQHTFPQLELGTSNNLMDYADSVHLGQRQWYNIHNNYPTFSFWDGEEDASSVTISNIEDLDPFRNADGYLCFLTAGGEPITLSGNVQKVILSTAEDEWVKSRDHFPIGALVEFQMDGTHYVSARGLTSGDFLGYVVKGTDSWYIDSLSSGFEFVNQEEEKFTEVLMGTPCITSDGLVYKVFPTSKFTNMLVELEVSDANKGAGPHYDLNGFAPFFERESEGVQVRAMFSSEMEPEEWIMFQELSGFGEVCGEDAVWAFSASHLFHEYPEELPCISAIVSGAEEMSDAYSTSTYEIIQDLHPVDQPIIIRPEVEPYPYGEYALNYSTDHDENFFRFFYEATASLIHRVSPVQNFPEYLEDYPLQDVADYLLTFETYQRRCILITLPFETRMELLRSYTDWGDWSTSKESLLVDLIATTPVDEGPMLFNALRANNNELYWGLYGDINGSNSDAYVAYVSLLALELLPVDDGLQDWPSVLEKESRFIPIWKQDLPEQSINAQKDGDDVLIQLARTFGEDSHGYRYQGDPFEFVRLRLYEDYQFQNITTGEKLKEGDELIVPSAWAYWIIDRQETIENWEAVRIVLNVAAAAVAIATMEPGPLLAVELLANGTDIALTLYEDEVMSSGSAAAQEMYTKFSVLVGLLDATAISGTVLGGIKNYAIKNRQAYQFMNEASAFKSTFSNITEKFKEFILALRQVTEGDFIKGYPLFKGVSENLYKHFKLEKYGRSTVVSKIEMYMEQEANLFFKASSGDAFAVARVLEDGIDGIRLDNVRWKDSYHNPLVDGDEFEILHFYDNVPYKNADGSGVTGNLEVIQAKGSGAIFIRVAEPFDVSAHLGKTTTGLSGNLVDIEAPVGEFRQLKSNANGTTYRAADFWKAQKDDFEHFISDDGRWYVKRDPESGRVLFLDLENKRFAGYGLDDDGYFSTYEKLLSTFKWINGIDGGHVTLTTAMGTIELSLDKANVVLGRLDPSGIPGGIDEIGINQIKDELGLLRNYSFANNGFELNPNSLHILNISDAMDKTGDFFLDFNLDFLKLITENVGDVRVVLATSPELHLLKRYSGGEAAINPLNLKFKPSIFAQEIKYLRENGIVNVNLAGGSLINLNEIDLSMFDWSNWAY